MERILWLGHKKRALLITGGEAPGLPFLKDLLAEDWVTIVCADSGADVMVQHGYYPDAILGDYDSASSETMAALEAHEVKKITYPHEKDFSDTEAALAYLFDLDIDEVVVLGAGGGRWDHYLVNVFLLAKYGKQGKSVIYLDEWNMLTYLPKGHYDIPRLEAHFTLIPLKESGAVCTLDGLYYPLFLHPVPYGSTLCLSNEFAEDWVHVSIHEGDMLLILSREKESK